MKSQHRHDLQTNELGKVADKVYGSVGSIFERHGNKLMIVVSVACVAGAIFMYKIKGDRARETAAWRELAAAAKADEFADVWKNHPDTAAAQWAHVHEGESRLTEGIQLLFSNVESGTEELKKAREALQSMVDRKSAPAAVRERGLFGLARCLEALSDGNEADALKTYERLRREFPASIYKKDIDSRIAVLGEKTGEEFYAWFASYTRPKATKKGPRDRGGDPFGDPGDLMNEVPTDPNDEDSTDPAAGIEESEESMPPEPSAAEAEAEAPSDDDPQLPEEPAPGEPPADPEGDSETPSP
ncbi:MAG: tetratricopeptide repeat protein [Planctomycetaceae bacterium]|nr:tetratricopeptide repeat protein [Planctomycetaceae bacterium]